MSTTATAEPITLQTPPKDHWLSGYFSGKGKQTAEKQKLVFTVGERAAIGDEALGYLANFVQESQYTFSPEILLPIVVMVKASKAAPEFGFMAVDAFAKQVGQDQLNVVPKATTVLTPLAMCLRDLSQYGPNISRESAEAVLGKAFPLARPVE